MDKSKINNVDNHNKYCIINSMEDYFLHRNSYKKFVIMPSVTLNEFSQGLIVDNRGLIYSKRFLDKYLTEKSFDFLNIDLVKKNKKFEPFFVDKSQVLKQELINFLKQELINFLEKDFENYENLEEILYTTENLYRDIVSTFTLQEKKRREKNRNRLISLIPEKTIINSLLLTNYDKKRILKIKKINSDIFPVDQCHKTFSIITTIYNKEAFVEPFFESLVSIKYPRAMYEVIIIDDGSNDNSFYIEEKLKQTDINYKYIKTKNFGVSIARNTAMSLCRCEYILFWDFDDQISSNILFDYNKLFKQNSKLKIASCPIYYQNKSKLTMHPLSKKKYTSRKKYSIINISQTPNLYISNVAGVAVNRKLVKKVLFTPSLNFFEDSSWITRVLEKNKIKEYGFINDILYTYTQTDSDSLISRRFSDSEQIKLLLQEYLSVLSNSKMKSSRFVMLKSFNWFLSEALNSIESKLTAADLNVLKKIVSFIGEEDYSILTADRVVPAVKLLKEKNYEIYQTYTTSENKIEYMLFSNYEYCKDEEYINEISIFKHVIGYEVKKYHSINYTAKKKISTILLMDRIFLPYDNAYYFYKYLSENSEFKIYFALSDKSSEWNKLEAEGFNLVSYASLKYKELLVSVDCIISSHVDKFILNYGNLRQDISDQTFIFLQHGVTTNDLKYWLFNKKIDYICSTYEFEKELLSNYFSDSQIITSGMPRTDYLVPGEKKYLTYFTSWSKYLNELKGDEFKKSAFFKRILEILTSDKLKAIATENNLSIEVKVHPNLAERVKDALKEFNLDISNIEYQELIKNSHIAITDYSSVIFDCVYTCDYVFFYNYSDEEYFCEKKIIQKIDYNDFFIKKIDNLVEIESVISEKVNSKKIRKNCCQALYEKMGEK